jgi:hypothetical protein
MEKWTPSITFIWYYSMILSLMASTMLLQFFPSYVDSIQLRESIEILHFHGGTYEDYGPLERDKTQLGKQAWVLPSSWQKGRWYTIKVKYVRN